ncbi:MAG: aminoacyl-tRNA hydrolase [Pseudomonadota bacterium]
MLLLVGLGNPGEKYARQRHNVGFMAIDAIADAHSFPSPERSKFQGRLREGMVAGRKCLLLKPETYMNESGRAVGEALRFYRIPLSELVVFHDELDLAPGKIRVKTGGGAAGHNGIRSIAAHVGPDFRRVRIGIGHPGDKTKVSPYVLGDFAKADAAWLDDALRAMANAAPKLAEGDDPGFMSAVALSRGGAASPQAKGDTAKQTAGPGAPAQTAARAPKAPGGPMAAALRALRGDRDT